MPENETPTTLPRGEDVMRGFYPGSWYLRYFLSEPVITDEQAEELVALAGYLEDKQAKLDAWYAEGNARIARAIKAMQESAAYQSLASYVKEHPTKKGGKSLSTAYGEIKLRKQKGILRVYDEKLARELCPEATYEYQAPVAVKLSKDKLKDKLDAEGPLVFQAAEGPVVVAEVIPEIETMSINAKPSAEMEGEARPPRLLEESLNQEEAQHENANHESHE